MVCTMTFGRRSHFAESSSLTNVYHLILLCDCPEFDPHDHQLARRWRSHYVIMISLCCQQMWLKTTARWGFLLSVCNSTHLLLEDYHTSASNFPPSHCFLFLTPSASSSPSLFLFFCLFLRFVPFVSLSLLQNHGRLRYVYALFSKLFPCTHKKSYCTCFPTWIVTSIIVLLLYTCVSLCWEWFSFFFFYCQILFFLNFTVFFFFLTDVAIYFLLKWEKAKLFFKILQSPLCVAVVMQSSVQVFKLSWLTWRVGQVILRSMFISLSTKSISSKIVTPWHLLMFQIWAWKTSCLSTVDSLKKSS